MARKQGERVAARDAAPGGAVQPSRDLLRRLALAAGPPGAEGEVRDIVRDALAGAGSFQYDAHGSIICEARGTTAEPRVVLDCHMDEVAFMVQSIGRDGMLRIIALGGWWTHVLLAQRVQVLTDGGKVHGVITSKPPHFLSTEERARVLDIEQIGVDVGARSADEAAKLGIRLGDPIVPYAEFIPLAGEHLLSCKAFDNRAGVGLMCETLRAFAKLPHPNTLIGVGAVQEEVGCRGARTASAISRPDVAIVLEGTPADDMPPSNEPQAALGRGPQIRFSDPTALSNRRLVRYVEQTAAAIGTQIQLAVRRTGGTNASSIHTHGSGVPTVVIGVPARYIHTHVSIIDWRDYSSALALVIALVERLDAAAVAGFRDYG
ncbi:MAG: M42 family metallopeptidase [Planctomycetes bacterium]|nr:M42 family metallopeptidase [Planctomycetota bacterium]